MRDTYDLGDRVVIVTTDRQSAFDRLLASIPFKGQVLNQTAAWWLERTRHIVPNALLGTPDPNVAVMNKCDVFPVEFVVRGFMTGKRVVLFVCFCFGLFVYLFIFLHPLFKRNPNNPTTTNTSQAAPTRRCGRTTRPARASTAATPSLTA